MLVTDIWMCHGTHDGNMAHISLFIKIARFWLCVANLTLWFGDNGHATRCRTTSTACQMDDGACRVKLV